tara:strand:+ start:2325 stop:2885 length:561 start_codon:yes stop_codon:yes gene_type:complete
MKLKNILFFLIAFILIFSWGYHSHKKQIFPHKVLKTFKNFFYKKKIEDKEWEKKVTEAYPSVFFNYQPGSYIFNDRKYINYLNDKELVGFTILQLPRHYTKSIKIEALDDIIIYRILCKKNNNDAYKNWQKVNFKVNIIGKSCRHTDIVRKKFSKQIITLLPGGPISADPIFIDEKFNYKSKFKLK